MQAVATLCICSTLTWSGDGCVSAGRAAKKTKEAQRPFLCRKCLKPVFNVQVWLELSNGTKKHHKHCTDGCSVSEYASCLKDFRSCTSFYQIHPSFRLAPGRRVRTTLVNQETPRLTGLQYLHRAAVGTNCSLLVNPGSGCHMADSSWTELKP